MLAPEENPRTSEPEASIARLIAGTDVLTQVLTQAGISSSDFLECLYCTAENDLVTILRLAAALSPEQRAQAVDLLCLLYTSPSPRDS